MYKYSILCFITHRYYMCVYTHIQMYMYPVSLERCKAERNKLGQKGKAGYMVTKVFHHEFFKSG